MWSWLKERQNKCFSFFQTVAEVTDDCIQAKWLSPKLNIRLLTQPIQQRKYFHDGESVRTHAYSHQTSVPAVRNLCDGRQMESFQYSFFGTYFFPLQWAESPQSDKHRSGFMKPQEKIEPVTIQTMREYHTNQCNEIIMCASPVLVKLRATSRDDQMNR